MTALNELEGAEAAAPKVEVGTEMFKVSFDMATVTQAVGRALGAGVQFGQWITFLMGLLAMFLVVASQVKALHEFVRWCQQHFFGRRLADKQVQTEDIVILGDVVDSGNPTTTSTTTTTTTTTGSSSSGSASFITTSTPMFAPDPNPNFSLAPPAPRIPRGADY